MGQTKDYLTAVDLAGYTESVDRTIADDHSSFNFVTCYVTICVRKYMTE